MGAFLMARFLVPRVAPKPVAPQLVFAFQQVVAFRYRTQDRVGLQKALLRRHELVVPGGHQMVRSDGFRHRLPVDRNHRGSHIDRGHHGTPECNQGGERTLSTAIIPNAGG